MSPYSEQRVQTILRKLTVASDPLHVEHLSREFLSERPPELLADMMAYLGDKAGDEKARVVYMGILRLSLGNELIPQTIREEVYSILASRNEGHWARFLLPVNPVRLGREEYHPDPVVEDMPLGTKKWKARLHDRELLLRLARDADPRVLVVLLDNPKILEADVVVWAARRPCSRESLLLIASHRKWSVRSRVQEALSRNPYCPVHVATGFLPLFTTTLLKTISEEPSLHELVRSAAVEILAHRGRR